MFAQENTARRIEEIQYLLATGKTRPEVAKALGYKNAEGLYRYAARKNMKWNPTKNNYEVIGEDGKPAKSIINPEDNPTGKAANIISMFKRGLDGRDIAKKLRYSSYQQLADYMKSQGYVWDEREQNYIRQAHEIKARKEEKQVEKSETIQTKGFEGLENYADLLKMLYTKKEKLFELLEGSEETQSIPRYVIPGTQTNKTIGIIDTLDRLIKDFCNENNMTQKELFEIAVIEFLKRYGFSNEVKAYLKV